MLFWSVILLITFVYLYNRNRKVKELCNFLPGPVGYPFIGNGLDLSAGGPQDYFDLIFGYWKVYGNRFRLFFGEQLVVFIADPKDVEVVLSRQDLIEKSEIYDFMKPWLGTGLLTSGGEKWKKRRRVITPTFHFKILENFIQVFEKQGDIFIDKLRSHAGKGEFDIHDYITLCALDIICESAMRVSVNAQQDSDSIYVKAVKNVCNVINNRIRNPLKRPDFLFQLSSDCRLQKKSLKILHGYTDSMIKQRKKIMENSNASFSSYTEDSDIYGSKKKMAFLDMLLLSNVDGKPLSDLDIREEVDTFLFEGHDTISSALGFFVYEMAKNVDVQNKLFKEQMEIFSDDKTRSATHGDLLKMKYLELVIKETLRLHPSVPVVARKVTSDVNINGMEIAKGASIFVLCYNMNRNPEIFPDPEKFIPERFLPEETNKRHPYSSVFFSAGPRNCIGQKFAMLEMKSTLSKLVRNFVIEPTDQSLVLTVDLILKSVNGINVRIKSR